MTDGFRESTERGREFLLDLRRRDLTPFEARQTLAPQVRAPRTTRLL
jgi:hypothetical protein